jgi:putative tricarboxylic transport membrane protein
MRLRNADGIFFLVPALLMAIGSWQLGLGAIRAPGPGLYPMIIAVLIGGLSVLQMIYARTIPSDHDDAPHPVHAGKAIAAILALVFFLLFLPIAGVAVTTAIFLATLFWIGGIKSVPHIALLALVIGIAAEVACRMAGIPLPANLIWTTLASGT